MRANDAQLGRPIIHQQYVQQQINTNTAFARNSAQSKSVIPLTPQAATAQASFDSTEPSSFEESTEESTFINEFLQEPQELEIDSRKLLSQCAF